MAETKRKYKPRPGWVRSDRVSLGRVVEAADRDWFEREMMTENMPAHRLFKIMAEVYRATKSGDVAEPVGTEDATKRAG